MKIRMQITKDADIRFVSHLDYLRAIERSIRRAELPVEYSSGFNPHLKFSLASALGVGIVSSAEFVEMEMAKDIEVN
ncbi:MAG: TIGR03936 family radical SAM-associated protein, partial [Acidaminococcaceae bacterium]|nr:TIGR03936 family radical SAM-associated protein [Acidaminococcaceae bacterium]